MKRLLRTSLATLVLAIAACSTSSIDEGTGSNTNWLKECKESPDCDTGFTCECGVCTTTCDANASCREGVCADETSATLRSMCGDETIGNDREGGICLRSCDRNADCDAGLCLDGSCVAVTSPPCPADAQLELISSVPSPRARVGGYFSSDYYVPVYYEDEPTDWVEPIELAGLHARVTDSSGLPIPECTVTWLTGQDHGWARADAATTNAAGAVVAHWVAGRAENQTLRAAIRSGDEVVEATLEGSARAHDEAPQSTAPEASPSARAVPVYLQLPLSADAEAIRLVARPRTFPAHTLYSVVRLPAFSLTLHNTSDIDAGDGDVPASDRLLSTTAWNLPDDGPTEVLFQSNGLECGPATGDLEGTDCTLEDAWTNDETLTYTVELVRLSTGETPPSSYAARGVPSDACAAPESCTDYLLTARREGSEPQLLFAARLPASVLLDTWTAYVDPYTQGDDIPTCLDTARHELSMSPLELRAAEWQPLTQSFASSVYTTWYNEICANHGVEVLPGEFRLWSGGNQTSATPLLPGRSVPLQASSPDP